MLVNALSIFCYKCMQEQIHGKWYVYLFSIFCNCEKKKTYIQKIFKSSNPIPFVEIKQICEKKSNNLELIKYLDHYISVIGNYYH